MIEIKLLLLFVVEPQLIYGFVFFECCGSVFLGKQSLSYWEKTYE